MTETTEDRGSKRRPIRVAIRNEDVEDVLAHAVYRGLGQIEDDVEGRALYKGFGQTEDDVEGQVYLMSVHRKGDPDDTQGQAYYRGLEPVGADDTEGQGLKISGLTPVGPDGVEGQGMKYGYLKPDADGDWIVELDNLDDTEAHGFKIGG
jgi:hypothetical protein